MFTSAQTLTLEIEIFDLIKEIKEELSKLGRALDF